MLQHDMSEVKLLNWYDVSPIYRHPSYNGTARGPVSVLQIYHKNYSGRREEMERQRERENERELYGQLKSPHTGTPSPLKAT